MQCSVAPGGRADGFAWCDDYTGAELIGWALPLGLVRQQWDALEGSLTLTPHLLRVEGEDRYAALPWYTPHCTGTVQPLRGGPGRCARIDVHTGELFVRRLAVGLTGCAASRPDLRLVAGLSLVL